MTADLNKYFDADREPTFVPTAEKIFEASIASLAAVVRLHDLVEMELKELYALRAELGALLKRLG